MDLDKLIGMEMQNISRQDRELLADMECTLGLCGVIAQGGDGSCGEGKEQS